MKIHSNIISFEQAKRFVFITVWLMAFVGCGKNDMAESSVDEGGDKNQSRVITLTANIPEENASNLKFAITPDGPDMSFSWEEGDEIHVCIVKDAVREKQTVPLKNISADGKTATFDILLPAAIQEGTFDMYGVYGGQGLDNANPVIAKLPVTQYNNWNGFSDLRDRNQIMLKFVQREVDVRTPSVSVNFEHLGSLFHVLLKNVTTNDNWGCRYICINLIGENTGANAAIYGHGAQGATYNMETGTFAEGAYRTQVYIYHNYRLVPPGEICEWWAWYAPNPNFNPNMNYRLRLNVQHGPPPPSGTTGLTDVRDVSDNVPKRVFEAGKIYRFYTEWDGSLKCVNPYPF